MRVTAKGIWHAPTSFYLASGIGPVGSVFVLLTALLTVVSLTTDEPLRNMLVVLLVGGVIISGFAIRDRHKRHLYARAFSRVKWWIHRKTGRNLYEGDWLSTRPVTMSNLPGLLTQTSVAEQKSPRGDVAVVHHPAANVTSIVLECEPDGVEFNPEQVEGFMPNWERWVAQNIHEPKVSALMVTTVTAAVPKEAIDIKAKAYVEGDDPAAKVFREITSEQAGNPSTRVFTTVCLTDDKGPSRKLWTSDVLGPQIEQMCVSLESTGAGQATPVDASELARLWRVQFAPSAAIPLAEYPETIIRQDQIGPGSAVERAWGWLHEGYCTVGVAMTGKPAGLLSPAVYENAARGLPGVEVVRTVTTYRPMSGLERTKFFGGHKERRKWRSSWSGGLSASETAVASDSDETEADVARGVQLVKVGFTATATIKETGDASAAQEAAARLVGMCGPLGTVMRVMNRSHQTSMVATLPGGFPIPGAFTPLEDIE